MKSFSFCLLCFLQITHWSFNGTGPIQNRSFVILVSLFLLRCCDNIVTCASEVPGTLRHCSHGASFRAVSGAAQSPWPESMSRVQKIRNMHGSLYHSYLRLYPTSTHTRFNWLNLINSLLLPTHNNLPGVIFYYVYFFVLSSNCYPCCLMPQPAL